MSYRSKNKNTELLIAGLVAAATIGLAVYFASKPATAKGKNASDDKGETKKESSKPSTPANKSSSGWKKAPILDDTPKRSNVTDEKELHSKIEELDKKGKALFKNRMVRSCSRFFCGRQHDILLCCICLYFEAPACHVCVEFCFVSFRDSSPLFCVRNGLTQTQFVVQTHDCSIWKLHQPLPKPWFTLKPTPVMIRRLDRH